MIIETVIEEKNLIDLQNSLIDERLRKKLEGKLVVHGDDYIDDDFYEDKKIPMLIDTDQQFVYIQETEDTILMSRLLDRQILTVEEDGQMLTYTDELRFKGKLEEIKQKLENGSKKL